MDQEMCGICSQGKKGQCSRQVRNRKLISSQFVKYSIRCCTFLSRNISKMANCRIIQSNKIPIRINGANGMCRTITMLSRPCLDFYSYCPTSSVLYGISCEGINDFDVVEVNEKGQLRIVYSDAEEDNVLFISNKCNSTCTTSVN